ncbi:hypothetical protein RHMOL_Rhmol10G0242800 [Rhododendron molle]|uniref:Uncharacterized protein n=1 Tax=Rhododendron molle TaxID=49168 RepID=A0ACC0M6Q1_RHOML|nr:hypothetical protein RHMOL_Rhmol10G0242800 [Rhododendron molle]
MCHFSFSNSLARGSPFYPFPRRPRHTLASPLRWSFTLVGYSDELDLVHSGHLLRRFTPVRSRLFHLEMEMESSPSNFEKSSVWNSGEIWDSGEVQFGIPEKLGYCMARKLLRLVGSALICCVAKRENWTFPKHFA